MKIEILGTGCPKCKQLEANARKAVEEKKVKAEIVKVTDISKIMEYGVMSTPAIVIDGKLKSYGKVNDVSEIKKWL
jgi:small redox-active disulfide protein 2